MSYNIQNAKVRIVPQSLAENPCIRPLMRHLKHSCGGKNVVHYIVGTSKEIFLRSSHIGLPNLSPREEKIDFPITPEGVKKLIEWSSRTKRWVHDARKPKFPEMPKTKISNDLSNNITPSVQIAIPQKITFKEVILKKIDNFLSKILDFKG